MTQSHSIQQQIEDLQAKYAFFGSYTINENLAPHLVGNSPVDLGMALLFIEELGQDAKSPVLSQILCVTELTCKNWIKKLCRECLCDIEWQTKHREGRRFVVKSSGIFNREFYEPFRPYVRAVIEHWRTNDNNSGHRPFTAQGAY